MESCSQFTQILPKSKTSAPHSEVPVGEISVGIALSSPHRADALQAVQFIIDAIKSRVPIWKKRRGEQTDSSQLLIIMKPNKIEKKITINHHHYSKTLNASS
ncbi:molybdopterin synthase catalytic subunit domain protein [Opisthorchis viverrini]|uniref:Molybdopterin synthase catalytic subunit domain protein n=1 Tax=Opisthorchis viverrini TaxID=6198 RepID=A0A1S8X063_OPIVI|nr:molybdopterin synthase catalytic subunit domain protein [Opisthorchis viverrini]